MQKQLGMPAFMLYYENYTANFDPTVQQLYRFLGHPTVGDPVPFESGKSYMETYFDPKHARDAAYLIRALATDETWSYLRHYFKGILVERVSPEESITNVTSPTVAWLLSYPDPVRPELSPSLSLFFAQQSTYLTNHCFLRVTPDTVLCRVRETQ